MLFPKDRIPLTLPDFLPHALAILTVLLMSLYPVLNAGQKASPEVGEKPTRADRKKQKPTPSAKTTLSALQTEGSKIVDAAGATVRFSGLNWFGFETANNSPHGLWSRNWEEMLDEVHDLGYNSLRLPFSNAMLQAGVAPSGIDYSKNPDLVGLTSLEVMDLLVEGARQRGLWVILDNHRSTPGGGPESGGL